MATELHTLRDRQTSVEVLKEEKRALEAKIKTLEEVRVKLARSEAEVEAARREREEWCSSFAKCPKKS